MLYKATEAAAQTVDAVGWCGVHWWWVSVFESTLAPS